MSSARAGLSVHRPAVAPRPPCRTVQLSGVSVEDVASDDGKPSHVQGPKPVQARGGHRYSNTTCPARKVHNHMFTRIHQLTDCLSPVLTL